MVKNEYVIRNKKLHLVRDGDEFECSKEELTEIITRQDKNRAELSDTYLNKIGHVMQEAVQETVDVYYDVYKVALNGLLASGMDDSSKAIELAKLFAYQSKQLFTN